MDNTIHEKIDELTRRINELARQQTTISHQLIQLINELESLKRGVNIPAVTAPQRTEPAVDRTVGLNEVAGVLTTRAEQTVPRAAPLARKSSTGFEEFIGKNLASKVGILVTIVGIFIGAKYAIEHDMVSPAMRIIAGYISGAALVAVALRLKNKYEAYSSVLMGGGLAVLYFITYIAFSFYQLMPQVAAFALMLVFTAATVYAALLYKLVIIAHLGQVGAYAIPFLLSDNSGRYAVFFTYMAIINTGMLVVSLRKYWKSLFYTAFVLTWFIYLSWYFFSYSYPKHEYLAWTFLGIFFLIFYATFLAYKIIKKEQYGLHDVLILLSNAFIFYGIGYSLLNNRQHAYNFLGTFTLINAAIHLTVSQIIRRLQLADRALYYLILGLVIVFCTIAVPVQLDGNWVTLLWTAEAVLVFLIGRTRQAAAYEKLGVGLASLGFLSLLQDWFNHTNQFTFGDGTSVQPFANIMFVTGLLVATAQGAIIYFNRSKKYQSELPANSMYRGFYDYALPVVFLITSYFVFYVEINGYFSRLDRHAGAAGTGFDGWSSEVSGISFVTLLLYTMVFDISLIIINQHVIRNKWLADFSLTVIGILMFMLLTVVLPALNTRSIDYFKNNGHGLYFGAINVFIRYIVIVITAVLIYAGRKTLYSFVTDHFVRKAWLLMVHAVILGFISAEYLCWTTISGADNQYKLGLSIVWGIYALLLVVQGINKKLKYLRLAAIVLFLITLIKLFVYDLAGAGTITKTVSFISLGIILLLVSYLYNRYKDVLFGDGNE
jgi:uncharacterized membrane protein